MKYVLGLSFYFKSFKGKAALLRIFADNHLLEELTLDKDINTRTVTTTESPGRADLFNKIPYRKLKMYHDMQNKLLLRIKNNLEKHKLKNNMFKTVEDFFGVDCFSNDYDISKYNILNTPARKRTYHFPEKLFLFELDEKYLNSKITIECINHNNNFTNGFMTKSSYYNFFDIFLIPKSFFYKGKIKNILSRLFKNGIMESITRTDAQPNNTWPGAKKVTYSGNSYNTKELMGSVWNVSLGGHFTLNIDVVKKHKISLFSDQKNSNGIYLVSHETLLNIVFFDLINRINEDH